MSTGSERRFKESYETAFGAGLLIWQGGRLLYHRLPSPDDSASLVPYGGEVAYAKEMSECPSATGLARSLQRYFTGHPEDFKGNIRLDRSRWSSFGLRVAEALAKIPYGTTLSYGELAVLAGHDGAQRAVGTFLARNPYPVILPCHRVIRSDGTAGEFSAGRGWKARLLEIEGIEPKVG